MRKEPLKGGSLPRADPTDRAGGQATDPGDGCSRRGTRVSARVVAVAPGPSGGGPALPYTTSRKAKRKPLQQQRPDLAQPTPATTTATPFFSTPMAARLTDEQWEHLRPLMPPQKPPTGRPRRDYTARCSAGCFGSSERVLRGGICRKRSSGRGGRYTGATANGARKGSGSV